MEPWLLSICILVSYFEIIQNGSRSLVVDDVFGMHHHSPLLILEVVSLTRRVKRLIYVCVCCSNRVSVLMSEKTSLHLPTCEISPPRSIHSTLKKYMTVWSF